MAAGQRKTASAASQLDGHRTPEPGPSAASLDKKDVAAKATASPNGQTTVSDDEHHSYEFGGPVGVSAMMICSPLLMYYLWGCLVFYDGKLIIPKSFRPEDVVGFFQQFGSLVRDHAYPSLRGAQIYLGLVAIQLVLAAIVPGYQQEGLPVSSLKGKRLLYNCNALGCWYITLALAAGLQFSGLFSLSQLIDHFGEIMTWSMICGYTLALVCYGIGVTLGNPIRMSGNVIYDYFAGAVLNPRLGNIDIKMWCEVRIPWVLQFLLALAGCAKQYETYGYVSPNQAFMVLGTGLYINACAKGEELIPQTWDMVYEKFGWLLSFWNLAGVPFSYSYPILYMATHDPSLYRYPVWATVLLYATLLFANWVWDSSMSQKSYFKMETDGNTRMARKSFPQMPWARVKNPKFIQTKHGNRLLTDGWWKYARKPNYSSDFVQITCWCLSAGFNTPITYWLSAFFLAMLFHRTGRDFERCHRKYGKDWEEYMRVVPYKFIPGIW
ncbi:C-24(28) sterol reductase [Cystobasidiomycetes sp. EMM_F5]